MAVGTQSHALYYSIFNGKICRSFKEPTKTSISRTNKENRIVHEEFYDFIDGVISGIQIAEHKQYGKSWRILLQDGEYAQILQLSYSDGHTIAFLKLLPNVDLTASVKILPSLKMEEGKEKRSLFITQHGKALKQFWTKDAPGSLPQLEKKRIKGKDVWDNSDQMEFFEAFVTDIVIPKLPKTMAPQKVGAIQSDPAENAGSDEPIDDLPF